MEDTFTKEYENPEKRLKKFKYLFQENSQNEGTTLSEGYHLPNAGPIHNYNPNFQNNEDNNFEAIQDALQL